MDLRQQLKEGRVAIPQTGAVIAAPRLHPPFVVVDGRDVEVVEVTEFFAGPGG